MKSLELKKAAPSVRKAASLARGGVLVLTEGGRPVYAVVGVKDDLALEALLLSRNRKFMQYLSRLSARSRRQRSYSLEEARRELLGTSARRSRPRSRRGRRGPSRTRAK